MRKVVARGHWTAATEREGTASEVRVVCPMRPLLSGECTSGLGFIRVLMETSKWPFGDRLARDK